MITGMMRVRSVLLVSAIGILMSSSAQAASITVDANGILLSANDVIVNGAPYDVEFIDGTCAAVFGACDLAHFTFTTASDAEAASSALFDQVFLDGALGNFDSELKLTRGCNTPSDIDQCFALTPYGTFSNAAGDFVQVNAAMNTALVDQALAGYLSVLSDTGDDPESVFAKWTSVPQPVPDNTTTLSLLGLSVAIMLTMRRMAEI